jgi:hypothetical protein
MHVIDSKKITPVFEPGQFIQAGREDEDVAIIRSALDYTITIPIHA